MDSNYPALSPLLLIALIAAAGSAVLVLAYVRRRLRQVRNLLRRDRGKIFDFAEYADTPAATTMHEEPETR